MATQPSLMSIEEYLHTSYSQDAFDQSGLHENEHTLNLPVTDIRLDVDALFARLD